MSIKNLPEDDERRLNYWNEVAELNGDRDTMITYIIQKDLADIGPAREAKLAAEKEWSEDGYIQGLRDAWEGGMKKAHALEPTDESSHVFSELQRFSEQLEAILIAEEKKLRREYEDISTSELEEKTFNQIIETAANYAWLRAYRMCEVMYGTRDSKENPERLFETLDTVRQLAPPVYNILSRAYKSVVVEPLEGKDLQETPTS